MDLRPDEVSTFQNLVQNLINSTREPMRTLMSVHPEEISSNDVSVAVDYTEQVSTDWKLSAAVISGLPGGLTVALYDNLEAIGRLIKELAAPSD